MKFSQTKMKIKRFLKRHFIKDNLLGVHDIIKKSGKTKKQGIIACKVSNYNLVKNAFGDLSCFIVV